MSKRTPHTVETGERTIVHCMIAPAVLEAVRLSPQTTTISAQVQRHIALAFERGIGLDPAHKPVLSDLIEQSKQPGTRTQPVSLPKVHADYLSMLRRHTGFASNRLAYALGQWGAHDEPASTKPQDQTPAAITSELLRPHQKVAVSQSIQAMRAGKIVALEAGTGSGKSRILAYTAAACALQPAVALPAKPLYKLDSWKQAYDDAQAMHALRLEALAHAGLATDGAVVIAAPSVANIQHLMREWSLCAREIDPLGQLRCAPLLGRQQFVDPERLAWALEWLAQSRPENLKDNTDPDSENWLSPLQIEQVTRLRAWMHEGMPAIADGLPVAGLVTSAHALAPELVEELGDVGLSELSMGPAVERYAQHREAAQRADVIFTTHATLCMDTWRLRTDKRDPLLPPLKALCVDEAHLLESAQESTSGSSLSLLLAIHASRQGVGLPRTADALAATTSALVRSEAALQHVRDDVVHPDGSIEWEVVKEHLRDVKAGLDKLFKRVDAAKNGQLEQISTAQRMALMTLRKAHRAAETVLGGGRAVVNFSEKLRRVTLHVGSGSVRPTLVARWAVTPAALLTSGTLMTRTASGWNVQELLATLGIDERRLAVADEIALPWLYSTPTLLTPHPACALALTPPSADDEEVAVAQRRAWAAAQARVIARAARDAAGGTLVLCTGYDRVAELHEALAVIDEGRLATRLLFSSRDRSTSTMEAAYRASYARGQRPIWLATGAAWVGLDLVDRQCQPQDDLLLTDLVIPSIPYGIDQSLAAKQRRMRVGFVAERAAAWRRLRQGIGRLIRREGLRDRRVWILDGRLVGASTAFYTSDLRALLARYLHTRRFKI